MANKIGIFREGIYPSGGIETWLFNIAKRWGKTHDITIYFENADDKQLRRLQRLIRCVEYVGQDIEVDTAIWCYDFLGFHTTKAKRKIHGKKSKVNYKPVMVKNITSFDLLLPDGSWLEPNHVAVVDGYDGKTKGLKIVK